MHARRPQGVTPLATALPPQPLQSCRSSFRSAASSPRTPCGSPKWSPIYFSSAGNRNSTDSWNSSNGPDDLEWEWRPEQVLLLTRVPLYLFNAYLYLNHVDYRLLTRSQLTLSLLLLVQSLLRIFSTRLREVLRMQRVLLTGPIPFALHASSYSNLQKYAPKKKPRRIA